MRLLLKIAWGLGQTRSRSRSGGVPRFRSSTRCQLLRRFLIFSLIICWSFGHGGGRRLQRLRHGW